jgi:UDP-glucose 4-epimerase
MGKHTRNPKYKMKYLVTGGAGFIGSNLVDKLISLGHDVICIDDESAECHEQFYWNDKAQNYKYDICDYDLIAPLFSGVDCVFHVASDARIQPAILNPKKSIQSNAVGTANVLELCRVNKVDRLIYSSTSSAYGKKAILPNQEIQPSDPLTPYSASKVFGENLAKVYYNLYGLKTISLRYFNVYGDRQPLKGQYAPVIGLFLKQYHEGKPLTVVGNGSQRRDFTHISDVIQANILASEVKNGFGEVYNIGYGSNYAILNIANMISNDVKFIPSRIGEVQETLASNQKFKDLTGWMPKVSLIEWLSK